MNPRHPPAPMLSPAARERARAVLRSPVSVGDHGFVETLPTRSPRTLSQRALDTNLTAWTYDRVRDRMLRIAGVPDFRTEVAAIAGQLGLHSGDTVLDLACGHGNFTVEWADRVGPEGLVVGLDFSPSMLRRAVRRVGGTGLRNVLLVHGDAHHLPLADGSVHRVNCSGGFHAFPDLPRALDEIARVCAPGATLTASTFAESPADRWATPKSWMNRLFALHFVHVETLGELLRERGFHDYRWTWAGAGFAYTSASAPGDPGPGT